MNKGQQSTDIQTHCIVERDRVRASDRRGRRQGQRVANISSSKLCWGSTYTTTHPFLWSFHHYVDCELSCEWQCVTVWLYVCVCVHTLLLTFVCAGKVDRALCSFSEHCSNSYWELPSATTVCNWWWVSSSFTFSLSLQVVGKWRLQHFCSPK